MNKLTMGTIVLLLGVGHAAADPSTTAAAQQQHEQVPPASAAAASTPQTEGEVRKIDLAAQKLTIRHGRIENLGMSPMTMVFRVKDPAFLTMVKPGDKIRMTVQRVDGALTIVALQRTQ